MVRLPLRLVTFLCGATCCVAADWNLYAAQPASLAERWGAEIGAPLLDGDFELNAGEHVILMEDAATSLLLIRGPGKFTFQDNGQTVVLATGTLIWQAGAAILPANAAENTDQLFELRSAAIESGQECNQFDPFVLGPGVHWLECDGSRRCKAAFRTAGANHPWLLQDSKLSNAENTLIAPNSESGCYESTGVSAAGELAAAETELRDAIRSAGISSARVERDKLQPKLVINLLAIDPKAEDRVVAKRIYEAEELRIVSASPQATATQTPQTGANTGVNLPANSPFNTFTFPSIVSPAGLAIGSADQASILQRDANRRTDFLQGQGLGTGGLFTLRGGRFVPVGIPIIGPGGLISQLPGN
ncbi:MAG: hypothetical protein AB7N71_04475 [Phycisphaerae bacterium]